MFIIGERINSTRKRVKEALANRDVQYVQNDARLQADAGAGAIDLNAAALVGQEKETLCWLVDVVQDVVSVPLCIDSPDAKAARAGLERVKNRPVFLNSISLEKNRYPTFLPLVKDFDASVVALCADDKYGMPKNFEDKLAVATALLDGLIRDGVDVTRIYVDCLVFPVGTDSQCSRALLAAISAVMQKYPGVHTVAGLSNVSYGLPERKLLNRTLLAMAIGAGMDAAILDPLDTELMATMYAAEVLAGRDEFCAEYIGAHRRGVLKPPEA
jgi:5-methyltetrahydrofolate--homocysteine methyltransferase